MLSFQSISSSSQTQDEISYQESYKSDSYHFCIYLFINFRIRKLKKKKTNSITFSLPIPNNNLSSACKKLNKGLILAIWQNGNVSFSPKKITFLWICKVIFCHSLSFYCASHYCLLLPFFKK